LKLKRKKVIFIGGTSYSGSTFTDMILANDPAGFSCGEVNGLFHPIYSYHINPLCVCGDSDCNIWKHVLSSGKRELFKTIFDLFPHVEFIVDSSKKPYWIRFHAKNLFTKGIECKHILIWKTPLEFAYSCKKRGGTGWQRKWINYHRVYFRAVKEWRSVKYSELANNPDSLKKICDYLKIPYFSSKANYWDKKHHTLFGNQSAKIHLKPKNSFEYKALGKSLNYDSNRKDISTEDLHRTIYYKNINDKALEKSVKKEIDTNDKLKKILELLKNRDISSNCDVKHIDNQLRSSWLHLYFQLVKRLTAQKLMEFKRYN